MNTNVCRTFAFLSINLNINYAQAMFAIFLKNIATGIIYSGNLISPLLARYNSVTHGRHSGTAILWDLNYGGKLSFDDRSAKTLCVFKRCISGKDLTASIKASCEGCVLCST